MPTLRTHTPPSIARPRAVAVACLLLVPFALSAFGAQGAPQASSTRPHSGASSAPLSFDKDEFAARRAKLFDRIKDGIAVVVGAPVPTAPVKFRQTPDFYYLTGIEEPDAVALFDGRTRSTFVFVSKRDAGELRVNGPGIWEAGDAAAVYGLTRLFEPDRFFDALAALARGAHTLYVPVTSPDDLQFAREEMTGRANDRARQPLLRETPEHLRLVTTLREHAPTLAVADLTPILDDLRWVKSPYEIERLRRSCAIGAEGVREAMKGTHPGMYEYEVEAVAEYVYTRRGARGWAFTPIVASGPNTVVLHYERNDRRMEAGDVVYMDFGADYDYYTSDITRTWPVSGTFSPDEEKMYACILDAREAIIAAMKPGATVKDLQAAAEAVYTRHGFKQEFLDSGRYVGHHVGLSVHDPNASDRTRGFEPGVVFNVEPLIEREGGKLHMRLEDTVLVTDRGAENLTSAAPAVLADVYALAKQRPLAGT